MRTTIALLVLAVLLPGAVYAGWNEEEDDRHYRVVINHEEQYSIWFADREIPEGWRDARAIDAGFVGSKKKCLDHIEEVWTDMRPLSFRRERGWERDERYQVVINHEEQYSIWFADREIPAGWREAGFSGSKRECLDYIEEVWTDMRPLSLRRHWR